MYRAWGACIAVDVALSNSATPRHPFQPGFSGSGGTDVDCFRKHMGERLQKFGLDLHPEKTRRHRRPRTARHKVGGDAARMAKDVDRTLEKIVEEHSGRQPDDAESYIQTLKDDRRYQRDVY